MVTPLVPSEVGRTIPRWYGRDSLNACEDVDVLLLVGEKKYRPQRRVEGSRRVTSERVDRLHGYWGWGYDRKENRRSSKVLTDRWRKSDVRTVRHPKETA